MPAPRPYALIALCLTTTCGRSAMRPESDRDVRPVVSLHVAAETDAAGDVVVRAEVANAGPGDIMLYDRLVIPDERGERSERDDPERAYRFVRDGSLRV